MTATPNQALQRTGSAVTAPATDRRRLATHRQVPRPLRLSLSLRSFDHNIMNKCIAPLLFLMAITSLSAKPIIPSKWLKPDTKATWDSFSIDQTRKFEWTIYVADLVKRPETLWSPDDDKQFAVDFTSLRKKADQVMRDIFGSLDGWNAPTVDMLGWGDSNGAYYYGFKFRYFQRKKDVEIEPGVTMTYENNFTIPVFF